MLTNWRTISNSIGRLRELDQKFESEATGLTKKELLKLNRERDRLERTLGGIREMGGLPNALFVIDTNKEDIAIKEARKLGIPIIAVLDSNCDPDDIQYPIPGNDDATRAVSLYCDLMAQAVLGGLQAELAAQGTDVGAAAEGPVEEVPEMVPETKAAETKAAEATETPAPAADGEKAAAPAAAEKTASETAPATGGDTAS